MGFNQYNNYDKVKTSYQQSYQRLNWSLAMEPIFHSIYDPALYRLVYTAYESGGYHFSDYQDSGGLFYSYPLKYADFFLNFDCKGGKSYFDFLCRPWYRQISTLKKLYDTNDPGKYSFPRILANVLLSFIVHIDNIHDIFFETPYANAGEDHIILTVCLLMQGDTSPAENRPSCLDIDASRT